MNYINLIGFLAGLLTTLAFLPQFIRAWQTKSTNDISLSMLVVFNTGLLLWLIYGLFIKSVPLVAANLVSLLLAGGVLILKLRYK